MGIDNETPFQRDLERLINSYSMERESNTPDYILAKYLQACLDAFNAASNSREEWYGRNPSGGGKR